MKEMYYDASVGALMKLLLMQKVSMRFGKFKCDMKGRTILCLLLLLFCLHVEAQQRKRVVNQRRPMATSVRKPVLAAITKTRKVGADGFVWYELRKGKLYGASNIEGKTIIPIKYSKVYYVDYIDDCHYFQVNDGDFEGVYTRLGNCIIPTDKHFTYCIISHVVGHGKPFLAFKCKNNDGQKALYDAKGNEVIPFGDYDGIGLMFLDRLEDIVFISCEQNGLVGAFDLNGNLLVHPCANSHVLVTKDKIEIHNKNNGRYESKYIYGSYSENTRFDYGNYDRLYYPYKVYRSSSSSSSASESSSSSSSASSNSSSSPSSSSSSGTKRREVCKERWRICTNCDPDRKGYCRNCHGRGGYYIGNYYNVCGVCAGTGACALCGGRGEYKEVYKTWE